MFVKTEVKPSSVLIIISNWGVDWEGIQEPALHHSNILEVSKLKCRDNDKILELLGGDEFLHNLFLLNIIYLTVSL